MSKKNFDVVVYGATGFTGKLVVEYMLNQYGDDETISWAMAGRSHEKLVAVRDALGVSKDVPLLTVDSDDEESIIQMVQQTQCVLTTVGPYQLYGPNIVKQCVAHGTDYVDLCGEPGWMHEMISSAGQTQALAVQLARSRNNRTTIRCRQMCLLIFSVSCSDSDNKQNIGIVTSSTNVELHIVIG